MKKLFLPLLFSIVILTGCSQTDKNTNTNTDNSSSDNPISKTNSNSDQKITISTDKKEYKKGEIIKITVDNNLDKSILYRGGGDRFWGIEHFNGSEWVNPAFKKGGGFQLTGNEIGEKCGIKFFERSFPSELKLKANVSSQWNQKMCPFGSDPTKPQIVKFIESGKYRLTFSYGFKASKADPFKILNSKRIYSNDFTIK